MLWFDNNHLRMYFRHSTSLWASLIWVSYRRGIWLQRNMQLPFLRNLTSTGTVHYLERNSYVEPAGIRMSCLCWGLLSPKMVCASYLTNIPPLHKVQTSSFLAIMSFLPALFLSYVPCDNTIKDLWHTTKTTANCKTTYIMALEAFMIIIDIVAQCVLQNHVNLNWNIQTVNK